MALTDYARFIRAIAGIALRPTRHAAGFCGLTLAFRDLPLVVSAELWAARAAKFVTLRAQPLTIQFIGSEAAAPVTSSVLAKSKGSAHGGFCLSQRGRGYSSTSIESPFKNTG